MMLDERYAHCNTSGSSELLIIIMMVTMVIMIGVVARITKKLCMMEKAELVVIFVTQVWERRT